MKRLSALVLIGLVSALVLPAMFNGDATASGAAQATTQVSGAEPKILTNPTTKGRRGEPSLDDVFRPAAWIYMDSKSGTFRKKDDKPLLAWFIEESVRPSPTFLVRVDKALLGKPHDFSCVIDRVEGDGPAFAYAIAAKPGKFKSDTGYRLLNPGDDFIIHNRTTGDLVTRIGTLLPGEYRIMAAVKNLEMKTEALAVTQFTVRERVGYSSD